MREELWDHGRGKSGRDQGKILEVKRKQEVTERQKSQNSALFTIRSHWHTEKLYRSLPNRNNIHQCVYEFHTDINLRQWKAEEMKSCVFITMGLLKTSVLHVRQEIIVLELWNNKRNKQNTKQVKRIKPIHPWGVSINQSSTFNVTARLQMQHCLLCLSSLVICNTDVPEMLMCSTR